MAVTRPCGAGGRNWSADRRRRTAAFGRCCIITKRITAFAGHYGSGKTHLALNYALHLRAEQDAVTAAQENAAPRVCLVDLDIVNPYYRTHDARVFLEERGVLLVSSVFAGSNMELPAMPPDAVRIFDDKSLAAVLDVGGDDRGALALGRYAPRMADTDEADMLLVINAARPLTGSADDVLEILGEIEAASHVRFTGVVNNTNLGRDTTADTVLRSHAFAAEVCEKAALPLRFTAVREDLAEAVAAGGVGAVFPLRLFAKDSWNVYTGL